jgi:Ca-activated chloride channel family protein
MSFAAPLLLLALIVVPIIVLVYVWHERHREDRAAEWATPALVPNLVQRPSPRMRHLPAILFLIGLTFLLVGFARPEAKLKTEREGATVVLTIDTSGSMATPDIKPTRLLAARSAALTFLQELPKKYKVALETFTDHPAVIVAPTYDRKKLAASLPVKAQEQGTAVGDAVQTATRVAIASVGPGKPGAPHAPAAVLLISDGTQTTQGTSPVDASKAAKKAGVRVSTVLIGTDSGTLKQCVKAPGGFNQCRTQKTPVDPTTLQGIAAVTGGRFFTVTSAAAWQATLQRVYTDLGSHSASEHKKHEVTWVATLIALLFILAGVVVSAIWFRRPA